MSERTTRYSARAIIVNEFSEILLMKFVQTNIAGNKAWWVFPGGGVEKGESSVEALKREILEETGIRVNENPLFVWHRQLELNGKKGRLLSDESYYLIRTAKTDLNFSLFTASEKESFLSYKWWKLEEFKETDAPLSISNSYQLIKELLEDAAAHYPIELYGE